MTDLGWEEAVVQGYGKKAKRVKYISNTSLWGADGFSPLPIRWVLVLDPEGELDPLPLMSTDLNLSAMQILALYVKRWNLEVTFEEVREHFGVETQRQWSDEAIARTTVCLVANRLHEERPLEVAQTAWYEKSDATFSDLLKAARKALWKDNLISRKYIFESFLENNQGLDEAIGEGGGQSGPERDWIRVLVENLAAA